MPYKSSSKMASTLARVGSMAMVLLLVASVSSFPFGSINTVQQPQTPQQAAQPATLVRHSLPPFLMQQNSLPPLSLLHQHLSAAMSQHNLAAVQLNQDHQPLSSNLYSALVPQQALVGRPQSSLSTSMRIQSPQAAHAYHQHQMALAQLHQRHQQHQQQQQHQHQQFVNRPQQQVASDGHYQQAHQQQQQQQHSQQPKQQQYSQNSAKVAPVATNQNQHQQQSTPNDSDFLKSVTIIDTDGQVRNLNEFGFDGMENESGKQEFARQLKGIFSAISGDLQNAQFLPIDVNSASQHQLGDLLHNQYSSQQQQAQLTGEKANPSRDQQQPARQHYQFLTPNRAQAQEKGAAEKPAPLRSPAQAAREQVAAEPIRQEQVNVQQEHIEAPFEQRPVSEPVAPNKTPRLQPQPLPQQQQQQQQQQQLIEHHVLDHFDDERPAQQQQQPARPQPAASIEPVYHSIQREEANQPKGPSARQHPGANGAGYTQQPQQSFSAANFGQQQVAEQSKQINQEPPVEQQRIQQPVQEQRIEAQIEQQQAPVGDFRITSVGLATTSEQPQQLRQSFGFDDEPVPLKSVEHEPTHQHYTKNTNNQSRQQLAHNGNQQNSDNFQKRPAFARPQQPQFQQQQLPIEEVQQEQVQKQIPEQELQLPIQQQPTQQQQQFGEVKGQQLQAEKATGWQPIVQQQSFEPAPRLPQQQPSQPSKGYLIQPAPAQFQELRPNTRQQLQQIQVESQQQTRDEEGFGEEKRQIQPVQQQPTGFSNQQQAQQSGRKGGRGVSKFREAINKIISSPKAKVAATKQTPAPDNVQQEAPVQSPVQVAQQQQQQYDDLSPQVQQQVQDEQRKEPIDEQQQPIPLEEPVVQQQQQQTVTPAKTASSQPQESTATSPVPFQSTQAVNTESVKQRPKTSSRKSKQQTERVRSPVQRVQEQRQQQPQQQHQQTPELKTNAKQAGEGKKSRFVAPKLTSSIPNTPKQVATKRARNQQQQQQLEQQQQQGPQQQVTEITLQLDNVQEQIRDKQEAQQQKQVQSVDDNQEKVQQARENEDQSQQKQTDGQNKQIESFSSEQENNQQQQQQAQEDFQAPSERPRQQAQEQDQFEQVSSRDETPQVAVDEQPLPVKAPEEQQQQQQPVRAQKLTTNSQQLVGELSRQTLAPTTTLAPSVVQEDAQAQQKQEVPEAPAQQQPESLGQQKEEVKQQENQPQQQQQNEAIFQQQQPQQFDGDNSPIQQPQQQQQEQQQEQVDQNQTSQQTNSQQFGQEQDSQQAPLQQQQLSHKQEEPVQPDSPDTQQQVQLVQQQQQQQAEAPVQEEKTNSEAQVAQVDDAKIQQQHQESQPNEEDSQQVPTTTTTTTTTPRPPTKTIRPTFARKTKQLSRQQQGAQAAQKQSARAQNGARSNSRTRPAASQRQQTSNSGEFFSGQQQMNDYGNSRHNNQGQSFASAHQLFDTYNPLQFEPERISSLERNTQQNTNLAAPTLDNTNVNPPSSLTESY